MRSSIQAGPNVTPLVDVMLVLLVIFMVVAPTLVEGFVVEPPAAVSGQDHPKDSSDVVLGIDVAGRFYLNKRAIDSAMLGPKLRSLFAAGSFNHVLYLKGDKQLDYEKVLGAMDIARKNGVVVVGLVTKQPAATKRP
jgi:biopolymer transport protein TolR